MKTGHRIAEIARRADVSAATLRYYEQIGLLPAPERAENGYRVYDEGIVERLAFISRAKQLGCTLDEIGDLSTAWEGGECGPVQDRLRILVAEKIAVAETETVGLMTLSAELRSAAAALERHRPVGPCDEGCGCLTVEPAGEAPAIAVALTAKPPSNGEVQIVCTLSADGMQDRLAEWNRLLGDQGSSLASPAAARTAIPGGVRVTFAKEADIDEIVRLAMAEQDCCRFLSFAITIDGRGVGLEVTAPDDALTAVHALFGAAS